MAKKPRYFVIVAHCLLNPATRVHILGRSFAVANEVTDYFLGKKISMIQLPCPEFTAMGYWRNPQGRQQYDNTFFRKHCRKELESYVDMIKELYKNSNTPLCFIGIESSPTCSINWGKHKLNRYKTESIHEDLNSKDTTGVYGVMTEVLDNMLKELDINIPYLEAPVRENVHSEKVLKFFDDLDSLLNVPENYRYKNKFKVEDNNEYSEE